MRTGSCGEETSLAWKMRASSARTPREAAAARREKPDAGYGGLPEHATRTAAEKPNLLRT